MIKNGKRYLITTDDWFVAPNGDRYNAVWGKTVCKQMEEEMGFKPTHSANWFAKIGTGEGEIIIAGCQIHFAIKLNKRPELNTEFYIDKVTGESLSLNRIYIPPSENEKG